MREVLVTRDGNGARIEIRADQPLKYTSYLMPELAKWVIDLAGAKTVLNDDESKQMRTPPLERITVRQKKVNGDPFTRIGLDFKGEVEFSLTADPLDKGHLIALMTPSKAAPQKLPAAIHASAATLTPPAAVAAVPAKTGQETAATAPPAAAKTVTAINITRDVIRIEGDGKFPPLKPFLLSKPGRLVIDLAGIGSGLQTAPVPANSFGIVRCRLGNNSGRLRIVFESGSDTFPQYRLKEIPNGMEIIPVRESQLK